MGSPGPLETVQSKANLWLNDGPGDPSYGDVAELADALDLGSSFERSAGSIPVIPIGRRPIESRQEKVESRDFIARELLLGWLVFITKALFLAVYSVYFLPSTLFPSEFQTKFCAGESVMTFAFEKLISLSEIGRLR